MSRVRHASTHVQLLQGTDNLTHSEDEHQQVCVQLHTSAVNVTLLAFAAERRAAARAAAPLLLGARRLPLSLNISHPHGA